MDLESQLSFIQSEDSNKDSFDALRSAISNFRYKQSESSFNSLVGLLRPFMIRHTKSQRINGSEALALPPSTTSTIMLKCLSMRTKHSTISTHRRQRSRITAHKGLAVSRQKRHFVIKCQKY